MIREDRELLAELARPRSPLLPGLPTWRNISGTGR